LGKFDSFVTALAQKRIAPVQKVVKLGLESAERRGFKYSALAQPEVLGDVERDRIPGLISMRETVVAAARKAGIDAEDYFVDTEAAAADENEPY
jgi:hypothetical protein